MNEKLDGKIFVDDEQKICIAYDQASKNLRIEFPLNMWIAGQSVIDSYVEELGARREFGIEDLAMRAWVFMTAFDFRREFRVTDMCMALGKSNSTVAKVNKLVTASGLCTVDKYEWSKKYGATYDWYPRKLVYTDDGSRTSYDYALAGTGFADMLDEIFTAFPGKVYTPVKADDNEHYPQWVYVSPYHLLTYRYSGGTVRDLMREACYVSSCVSKFGGQPRFSHRLYNGFHNMPRDLRKNIEFNGSPLTELFDLHCSFYTLSVGLFKDTRQDISREALEKFFNDCVSGKLYAECARFLMCDRECAKEKLQGWRNIQKNVAHSPLFEYTGVARFMENNYPEIAEVYYNWPVYDPGDGRKVKKLQLELCDYETGIISRLAREIGRKYGVTCFTLHDGIYVSEAEKNTMPADINDRIIAWFRNEILG